MGGPDASLSGLHGCSRQVDLLGGPMSLVPVTYVEAVNLPSWVFFVLFLGMFCLFRAALLSASPAVYWLGMVLKHKIKG